jgi:cytochrome c
MRLALSLLALAALPAWAQPGKQVFEENCAECHGLADASTEAPTLKGVVGRKVASLGDFQYTDALKQKGGVWTEANLDAFLTDPQAFAPGTTMYVTVPASDDRKALIDYLKSVK